MLVQHIERLLRYLGLGRQGRQRTSMQRNKLGWNAAVGHIYHGAYEVGCGGSHQGISFLDHQHVGHRSGQVG